MANTFITNTSKFRPFSFQEMLQPYQIYTDAYNAYSDELANLDIMAGDIASKLTNPEDKELQATYQKYQDDLNAAMEDLYSKGLTADSRKKLASLKARYTKDLNPINDAYKAYQEDRAYLQKLAIEHPEMLIQGAGESVSAYMNGNRPQMLSVNRDDLMNQAMTIAKTQSGRTYRQSGWTPTAGGRFLERSTETGLNDTDFNNALSIAMSGRTDFTPEELGITSEYEFNRLMTNAALVKASISDIINSPDYNKLTDANKQKALNSIIKGVRAGFQYDRKVETESDPMFAHNLALERDALKRQQDALDTAKKAKKDAISNIGSSTYRAVNLGKIAVSKYLTKDKFGNFTISDEYQDFINSQAGTGILKSRDYLLRSNRDLNAENPTRGSAPMYYNPSISHMHDITKYDDFVSTIEQLGLDPKTATKKQIIDRMLAAENDPDAFGRKRASIVTPDTDLIQTYIEKGLKNNELQEIEGFEKGEDGVFRYKNKESVKLDKLLDSKGKLNILSIDMDYTTGERTFTVKDKKGNLREFRIPEDASFESTDQLVLNTNTARLRDLESKIDAGLIIDDGKTLYITPYGNITASKYRDMLQDELDYIFISILNYMGKSNINN